MERANMSPNRRSVHSKSPRMTSPATTRHVDAVLHKYGYRPPAHSTNTNLSTYRSAANTSMNHSSIARFTSAERDDAGARSPAGPHTSVGRYRTADTSLSHMSVPSVKVQQGSHSAQSEHEIDRLRTELLSREDAVIAAKNTAKLDRAESDRTTAALQSKIASLDGKIRGLEREKALRENDIEKERETTKKSAAENERLRESIKTLTHALAAAEGSAGRDTVKLEDMLRRAKSDQEHHVADLKRQLAEEVHRREREVKALEGDIKLFEDGKGDVVVLKASIADLKRQLAEAKSDAVASQKFVFDCEVKEKEISRLEDFIQAQKAEAGRALGLRESLESRLAREAAEHANTRRELAEARRQHDEEVVPQIKELQAMLQQERSSSTSQSADTSTIAELQVQLVDIRRAQKRQKNDLDSALRRSQQLEEDLAREVSTSSEHHRRCEAYKADIAALQEELRGLAALPTTIKERDSTIMAMEETIERSRRDAAVAAQKIVLLESKIAQKEGDMEGLTRQLTASHTVDTQRDVMEQEVQQLKTSLVQKEERLAEQLASMEALQTEVRELSQVAMQLQTERESLSSERTHYEAKWREERAKHAEFRDKFEVSLIDRQNDANQISIHVENEKEIPQLRVEIEHLMKLKMTHEAAIKERNNDIITLESAAARLQLEKEELGRRCTRLSIECDEKSDRVSSLEEELSIVASQLGETQVSVDELRAESLRLQDQQKLSNAEIERQKEDFTAISAAKERLGDDLRITAHECSSVRSELAATLERLSFAERSSAQQTDIAASYSRRIEELESDNAILAEIKRSVAALEGENDGLRRVGDEKDIARVELEKRIAGYRGMEDNLREAETQNGHLRTQIAAMRDANVRLEGELEAAEAEAQGMRLKLGESQRLLVDERRIVATVSEELRQSRRLVDELEHRSTDFENRSKGKAAIEGRLAGLEQVQESTQADLRRAKQTLSETEQKLAVAESELKTVVPALRREIKELKVHGKARQELFDSLQHELDERSEKIRALQHTIDEKGVATVKLSTRIADLEAQIVTVCKQNDRQKQQLAELSATSRSSEERLKDAVGRLKTELAECQDEVVILKDAIATKDRDVSRAAAEVERFKSEYSKSEHQIGRITVELSLLKRALDEKNEAHESSLLQLTECKEDLFTSQQTEKEVRSKVVILEEKITNLLDERMNDQRSKKIVQEALEQEIEDLRSDKARLNTRLSDSAVENESLQRSILVASAEKSSLEAQIVTLEASEAATRECAARDMDVRRDLSMKRSELERRLALLDNKNQQLESQLRVARFNAEQHSVMSLPSASPIRASPSRVEFSTPMSPNRQRQ